MPLEYDRTRERIDSFRSIMDRFAEENGTKEGGLGLTDEKNVIKYVERYKVNSIKLWFSDIFGTAPKEFSISPIELEGAFREGMGFDGSSVKGYVRIQESDMVARPLAHTAQLIPYKIGGSKVLRMFAEILTPDGQPYAGEPRGILKRSLESLTEHGLTHMNVGPEAEFFYFFDPKGTACLDNVGYFDSVPGSIGNALEEVTKTALEFMGIEVEYWHHGVGPSQHEIDLKYCDALQMADNLFTHKWLVKEIAELAAGVHATFMPKPLHDENGSGMHTHISLWKKNEDGNENAFFSKGAKHHLSDIAEQFIEGVLRHARETTLITNQWYNSYKRIVPGFEAPVYVGWARRNRSALIRIPEYRPGKEEATRIEVRHPDASCNVYLTFAVLLKSGLKGISKNYEVRSPLEQDFYVLSKEEREKLDVQMLPNSLEKAIEEVEKGTIVKETLGEEMTKKLILAKKEEHEEFVVKEKEEEDDTKVKDGVTISKAELKKFLKL